MTDIILDDVRPTDLRAPGKFALHLGESIKGSTSAAERYTSVRLNHKPQSHNPENVETTILRGTKSNATTLTLKDGQDSWTYQGSEVPGVSRTYVLLRNDNDSFTLEKLDALHRYRLVSEPGETDPDQTKKRYPSLPTDGQVSEAESVSEGELDVHNPFDFRNHLGNDSPKIPPTTIPTSASQLQLPSSDRAQAVRPPAKSVSPTKPVTTSKQGTAKPKTAAAKAKVRDPNAPAPRRGRPPKNAAAAATASKQKEAAKPKELALPPTAKASSDAASRPASTTEPVPAAEDDDDDLEAEMLRAMEEVDDNESGAVTGLGLTGAQPPVTSAIAEEEEESEEE